MILMQRKARWKLLETLHAHKVPAQRIGPKRIFWKKADILNYIRDYRFFLKEPEISPSVLTRRKY